jgi:hypothetical protein
MLETHIMMNSLIFCLVLIPMFHLAFTLVLRLTLFHMLCLSSLMDLTITHMILVHERIILSLDALVTARVLILMIAYHVGLVFPLAGPSPHFEPRHLDGPRFSYCGSRPTQSSGEVQRTVKTSSGCMVKCCIPKIYLTNPSTESSILSCPV